VTNRFQTMRETGAKRFRCGEEWRRWLQENHGEENEAWVIIQKVRSPDEGLRYVEAVDEAICFGWIDGKMRRLNDHEFEQRFSPRRQRSIWSLINRDRAERLIEEGRMTEAGLRAVEEAKSNGRWEKAYTSREPPEMPGDLLEALKESPEAHRNFMGFPNSARFMYIHWINDAKRAETRVRRIKRVVERATQNKKPGIDM
jgi:uncharacterized protein YdeI (YjbR/CyaY-like superfamily)